jgi:hypothetical protein
MTSIMNDSFPWRHLDPKVDALQRRAEAATAGECEGRSRAEIFDAVWRPAGLGSRDDCPEAAGGVPHLLEAWLLLPKTAP